MDGKFPQRAIELLDERFKRDALIALATTENGLPRVRTVDGYYDDGSFYVLTYSLTAKMKQIAKNPDVAICGDWFTAQGVGENIGWIMDEKNAGIAKKLREAFAAWYSCGHVDESDPNTCILRIKLTSGVLMDEGTRYELDFSGLGE